MLATLDIINGAAYLARHLVGRQKNRGAFNFAAYFTHIRRARIVASRSCDCSIASVVHKQTTTIDLTYLYRAGLIWE